MGPTSKAASAGEKATRPTTAQVIRDDALGAGSASDAKGSAIVGDGVRRTPDVRVVDEEMCDAKGLAQVEVPPTGADSVTAVSCAETDNVTVASVGGDGLPVPPAAPTNGNLSSVVGSKHKKSVSFVMEGADAEALLGALSDVDGSAEDKAVPPLPPGSPSSAGAGGVLDEGTVGANEAFLRRNFGFGGENEAVRSLAPLTSQYVFFVEQHDVSICCFLRNYQKS